MSEQAAETVVAAAIETGKLMPALKDRAVALCTENKPAFDNFVGSTSGGMQQQLAPLSLNRGGLPQSGRLNGPEREMAERSGLSPDDLLKYGA